MIVPKMWSTHVPVEIFGFQVQREHVGKNPIHTAGDVLSRVCAKITWRHQRGCSASNEVVPFDRLVLRHMKSSRFSISRIWGLIHCPAFVDHTMAGRASALQSICDELGAADRKALKVPTANGRAVVRELTDLDHAVDTLTHP